MVLVACHSDVDSIFITVDAPSIDARPPLKSCAETAGYQPDDLPTIPVGADAYRAWDKWPIVHLNQRTYMRSTYDRGGSNYDSSHFIRKISANNVDEYVTLDVMGNGMFSFFRANHWHGSPWDLRVDGNGMLVEDSSTATPDQPVPNGMFLPESVFPAPVAETWSTTQGADVWWNPIPFSSSLEIGYQQVHYGTGYYIYSLFPEGVANVSQLPCTWQQTPPASDLASIFNTTAADLPPAGTPHGSGSFDGSGTVTTLKGPGVVRALKFDVAEADAIDFGHANLRITWDGATAPSVDAQIGLFFGAGSLFNRDSKRDLVAAFPFTIRFEKGRVYFTTVFPMPFSKSAKIEVTDSDVTGVNWSVMAEDARPDGEMAFHATDVDIPTPTPGRDMVLLDTSNIENSPDWCGTFIGNSFTFTDHAVLTTLEGDPRFFFDDSGTPQAQGTGTEEWGIGGDYWQGGQTMTLAFGGHPVGATSAAVAKNAEDEIHSAYRVLLGDAMPFGHRALIQLEHGAQNDSVEHYRSVAFWYGQPGNCLTQSDELDIGDLFSESSHLFRADGSSPVQSLTSSYELGTISVPVTDTGRLITRSQDMHLAISPDNVGVMLRRRLDYAVPDQTAIVWLVDDATGAQTRVGTWYLAGSTAVVYADSPTERGNVNEAIVTSPNRWRDDEFLLPRKLTAGRSSLHLHIEVASPSGWSAFRYTSWSYTRPPAP